MSRMRCSDLATRTGHVLDGLPLKGTALSLRGWSTLRRQTREIKLLEQIHYEFTDSRDVSVKEA